MAVLQLAMLDLAHKFLAFVNGSPTPFHAVANAARALDLAGFSRLREQDNWDKDIKPGKYYFTRSGPSPTYRLGTNPSLLKESVFTTGLCHTS